MYDLNYLGNDIPVDYNDVLSLSSVVDVEYMLFKRDVYYHWYAHSKVA